jgi:hypothetical protein
MYVFSAPTKILCASESPERKKNSKNVKGKRANQNKTTSPGSMSKKKRTLSP